MIVRSVPRPRPAAVLALLLLGVALLVPVELSAQLRAYTLDEVLLWISNGVREARILHLVQSRCIDFPLDEAATSAIRDAGGTETLLAGLRARCVRRSADVRAARPRRYSRAALQPLYFGRSIPGTFFAGRSRITSPASLGPYTIETSDGETLTGMLVDPGEDLLSYGIGASGPGMSLELEISVHDPAMRAAMATLSYEPFLPMGRSGVRLIAGAGVTAGGLWQRMTVVPEESTVGADEATIGALVAGGEARAGLAYHFRPGRYIYATGQYRHVTPVLRFVAVNETTSWGDIPWPRGEMSGPALRIGLAF